MKRILFVDDDRNVLDGLRRGLHSMRGEWQMEFAASGKDALQALNAVSVDAVITDVRMPGMDGFELLNETCRTWPQVVRIVLTGRAGEQEVMRSMASTHFVLTKPCEIEVLKSRIQRALLHGRKIPDTALRALIAQVNVVPSLSTLFIEVMREFRQQSPDLEKIAQLVSMDMGMASAVLHFVNSGYLGTALRVSSPLRAVRWLGVDSVRELIISNNNCSPFDSSDFQYFDALTVWSDSMAAGTAARGIALSKSEDVDFIDNAFAAGLFHRVGEVVLARALGAFYDSLVETAVSSGRPVWEVERAVLGSTNCDVAAYLLGLWGLPDPVINALSYQYVNSYSGESLADRLVKCVSREIGS